MVKINLIINSNDSNNLKLKSQMSYKIKITDVENNSTTSQKKEMKRIKTKKDFYIERVLINRINQS